MNAFEALSNDPFFSGCISHSNFVLYVVLREYVTLIQQGVAGTYDGPHSRLKLYEFMYSMLKGSCDDPFICLKRGSDILPSWLRANVCYRFCLLRNQFETMVFTHPSSLKRVITIDLSENDVKDFVVMRDSVFGVFIRKFTLAFHCQSFEDASNFLDRFYEASEVVLHEGELSDKRRSIPPEILNYLSANNTNSRTTHENALDLASNVIKEIGLLGGRPFNHPGELYSKLMKCLASYHKLPMLHYATHLLATKKHNLIEAEYTLHSYFDSYMAANNQDREFSDSCAYMAVAAAVMHLSFGHWMRGSSFVKEALKKALECESKLPVRHVKITHALLNCDFELFRYGENVCTNKFMLTQSPIQHISVNEMRTDFWELLDGGSAPSSVLTFYCNSFVAKLPAYFTVCLLDLATVWNFYGYPILSTILLQCVINIDTLQPSPTSDSILAKAFAMLITLIDAHGCTDQALSMATACEVVLCRFSEVAPLRRARLEVELERNLRSGHDLGRCGRLVEALQSFCPWETTLRQAELEQARGNLSLSHDLLQFLIVSASKRLGDHLHRQQSEAAPPAFASTVGLYAGRQPLASGRLAELPGRHAAGGRSQLAQLGVRALFAQQAGMHEAVDDSLTLISCWCDRFQLSLGQSMADLLRLRSLFPSGNTTTRRRSLAGSVNTPSRLLDQVIGQLLHRLDGLTLHRCLAFATRARLHEVTGGELVVPDHSISVVDPVCFKVLINAFNFFRMVDDRKRMMNVLFVLAGALHAAKMFEERNQISKIFHMLMGVYKPLHPSDPNVHILPTI